MQMLSTHVPHSLQSPSRAQQLGPLSDGTHLYVFSSQASHSPQSVGFAEGSQQLVFASSKMHSPVSHFKHSDSAVHSSSMVQPKNNGH